jgi:hypothetical protein
VTILLLPTAAPHDESDLALARRVAEGDLNAFERIMRRHNRMLYRAAREAARFVLASAQDRLNANRA